MTVSTVNLTNNFPHKTTVLPHCAIKHTLTYFLYHHTQNIHVAHIYDVYVVNKSDFYSQKMDTLVLNNN